MNNWSVLLCLLFWGIATDELNYSNILTYISCVRGNKVTGSLNRKPMHCHFSKCLTEHGLLSVSFTRTSPRQSRAFSVVGPSTWYGLPLTLRSLPRTLSRAFLSQLKMVLF